MNKPLGPEVVRVDARTAIALVNADVMVGKAFRYVFKEKKFPYDLQGLLSIVTSQTYSWEGTATTTMAHEAGCLYLEKGKGAIDRRLREMENVYIVQRQNEENGTIWHWNLKNTAVQRAMEEVGELRLKINEVVALQVANPEDPTAGSHLVPAEVYYNVVAKKLERDAASEGEEL
ncbi:MULTISPECIES: hypothetical protein [unclassified Mesorhizobium]|uniref:hypothetical protein n=1 Tax=unclassified Mesorhizobium TaxID=325217 RepID=UPI000FDB8508|nr:MULTISPECIES: hypothetical protein [unclassified Mesorhizobium]TGT71803.1 hypothetical protein EN809_016625 [Mesorhizobium sp. M2E.F.Ca.ET.166.01.1.1]TGV99483.1 hypothetical protein EN797_024630 [Mesorhizobium sp. M2E.F.Ca.ET.154.01.1.1]